MSHGIDQLLSPPRNAALILADGTVFTGYGFGAPVIKTGEICFNTALTGYQEILTDPSYAGQIINFTYPHIGNVGTNDLDHECDRPYISGFIAREPLSPASNWRSEHELAIWLEKYQIPAITGLDTRALTMKIRDNGAMMGCIGYFPDGNIDFPAMQKALAAAPVMTGCDLAATVTTAQPYEWNKGVEFGEFKQQKNTLEYHVVAIDYGIKRNILRCLVAQGFKVTVVPANTSAQDILAYQPDGIFLSNGPGDPAATGRYAVPIIQELLQHNIPLFGICLGHQLLALALGGQTGKLPFGHRGANHPVMNLQTGRVEITSQNHGFEVVESTLPSDIIPTHRSLFDQTNEGIQSMKYAAFSVQYHPESSPGPHDSHYLFERFKHMIADAAQNKGKIYAKA